MNGTYREDLVRQVEEVQHAKFEQRLSESEHLATVGRLAATLAHEIKNPLAGISGAIQILGAGLDEEHPHKEIISEALRQIDRLDAAVKDLLVYARPKPPSMRRVDLNLLLERVLILFHQEPAFREVSVHCEGLNGNHELQVDEVQIQQVVSNLMINAAHACEHGGEVCCRISRLKSSIRIVIEDNGTGMPSEVLSRVFEPFFTTKSRGTGLGLPICQRIVEAHGGTIDIVSELGKGSRVTVDIPSQS
jgi:signal transduction histidine kinase